MILDNLERKPLDVEEDGRIRRLHQEDFCQILRIAPALKYEALGGPGIRQSMELLRKLALPATDTVEFLRRIVFFFLVGNGDAHGKNFSVLYHGRHVSLSPLYDVMSTTVYSDVAARLAMKIDGEFSPGPYSLGKQEADALRHRVALFKERTGTRKSLHLTLVTTEGLKDSP